MLNSKSQADNNSTIELQKPIETTSSPTCTKPVLGTVRFKFRAFNHVAKKMYAENKLGDVFKWQNEGQVQTIMQFTGLLDKKGKEIWEGDIVEAILNIHGKETDLKFKAKIFYNSNIGSFQISYKNIDDHFVNDEIWGRYFLEVIGNVYESPDLLR